MIIQEFDALVEANEKREYAIVHESNRDALREERAYLMLVEKVSKHKIFLDEAIKIVEKNSADLSILIEACVVVLSSDESILIDKVLEMTTSNDYDIPIDMVLPRLSEKKQIYTIEKLVGLANKKSLSFAGSCIVANGYSQFVKHFHKNGDIIETDNRSISYAVLSRLGGEEEKCLLEALFSDITHPLKKEEVALELIYAKSYIAREHIKNFETIHSFEIFPFLSLKEDADIYKNELIERLNDGDTDFLEAYIKITQWYGNPILIPFYIEMLKYKNLCMQFNELLMRFFYYDETIEPLEEKMEEWEEVLEDIDEKYMNDKVKYDVAFEEESKKIQKFIMEFWESKKDYIHKNIDMDKKYYIDEHFDILKIWKEAINDFWPNEAMHLHKGIQLLTGEYFAFDVNGLRSRQLQQSTKIVSFFEKYKQYYSAGEWYVWGKETEDELKSFSGSVRNFVSV